MGSLSRSFKLVLTRAERIVHTDLTYLLSGGIWLTAGQIGIAGIAFISSIAFAHLVPKETFGTYRFLLSGFWTVTAFGLTGIPTALARAVAQGKDRAYWTALRFSLIGSLPLSIVSLSIAGYYAFHANMLLVAGAIIIALIGPGMQASYLYGAYLEGKQAFKMNAASGIALNAVPLCGLLVLMFVYAKAPATAYLGIYLLCSVITASVLTWFALRRFPPLGEKVDRREFRSLGMHLSAMNILFTISQQIDKLLIFHALGAVQLAIYTFAASIPDQIRSLLGSIETLALPKFAVRRVREILPTLQLRTLYLSIGVAFLVALYIIAAPFIFGILFPAYMESVRLSQLYALSLIPIGSIVPVSVLQAQAAKRELYVYNTIVPVFQIITVGVGVYSLGILGVILSRIATRVLSLLVSFILVRRLASRTS